MNIQATKLVYFSPTGTTRRVLEGIAHGLEVGQVEHMNLTPPEARTREWEAARDGLALIGAPVYGGRIPREAEQRLRRIEGNGTPAVVVAVYGNRAYEDALLELNDLVVERGFVPVAGAAFIGEHSCSSDAWPIAHGRPDTADAQKAAEFGRLIRAKMEGLATLDGLPRLQVPGQRPYKERGASPGVSPVTREEVCTRCGKCAAVCPTAAIAVGDTVTTDAGVCILCFACVKNCPSGARGMEHPRLQRSREWLSRNCSVRKEPELYV